MEKKFILCLVNVKAPYTSMGTPLNLLSLGSYLVAKKALQPNQIKIINSNDANILRRIIEYKPDMVGLSSVTLAYPNALQLANKIKKNIRTTIIIGGHHITGAPEYFENPFDVGVMGEGEGALSDLVNIGISGNTLTPELLNKIPNVVYLNQNHKVEVNPMRPLLKPQDIPKYHWSLLEPEEVIKYETVFEGNTSRVVRRAQIFSARGCPYRCAFCARQIIWKAGVAFRSLPMEQIVNEIDYLYHTYHITALLILDDTFAVSKQRVRDLIENLRSKNILGKIILPWVFARANLVDEEFVSLLKELGVLSVFIGIESGSPKILRYLKNGSLSISQVKLAVKLFSAQKIRIRGSFMLFTPGEKAKDLDQTYNLATWFAHQDQAHLMSVYSTVPFPGTKLWEDFVIKKHLDLKSIDWKNSRYLISHPNASIASKVFFRNGFSSSQLDKYWKRMYILSKNIEKRTQALPHWKKCMRKERQLNNKLAAKLAAKLEMKSRLHRILHDPMRLFTRIFHHNVWTHTLHDLQTIIRT